MQKQGGSVPVIFQLLHFFMSHFGTGLSHFLKIKNCGAKSE